MIYYVKGYKSDRCILYRLHTLNKKGDYINYIIDYHFENIGEKVYLLTEKSGGYNITNNELFNQWKTEMPNS